MTAASLVLGGCTGADSPGDVTIGLVDYAFDDVPAQVEAGTTLTIDNRSDQELHELVAVRLPDAEERTAEELVQLPPEELGRLFAGVALVQLQAPGSNEVVTAVGDGTLTDPGRYLLVCMIPTGADPDAYLTAAAETEEGPPQGVAGGPPHLVNGMWAELDVTG
jgi:hypothetical protein